MRNTKPVSAPLSETAPVMAQLLGYAGALPFAGGALFVAFDLTIAGFDPFRLLVGYGAVILSFLGGLHWGRVAAASAQQTDQPASLWLVWSVVPSLLGWAALFMPPLAAVIVLSAGFILALLIDLGRLGAGLAGAPRWPVWMRRLRTHLTFVAVASILSSVLGVGAA